MTAEAEIGKIYRGKVVTIKEFGAFVEFLPGKDGLVHISELANFRVKQTEDIVKMGDEIWVKCLGVDEKGRVRLSRKAAMAERDAEHSGQPVPAACRQSRGPRAVCRGDPGAQGGGGGDRGGEDRGGERREGPESRRRPRRRRRGGGGGRPHRGGGGGGGRGPRAKRRPIPSRIHRRADSARLF